MKSERQPHATPQTSDVTIFRASRINVCCGALRRDWHKAADHTLIADGRFRGEADIHGRVAPTASVVHDPTASLAGQFCCDAQCCLLVGFVLDGQVCMK
jgi:hypothetical protein